MKRFLLTFAASVIATYVFNFFYFTAYLTDQGTGYYIANTACHALPWIITVGAALAGFAGIFWWLDN